MLLHDIHTYLILKYKNPEYFRSFQMHTTEQETLLRRKLRKDKPLNQIP